jgi:methanogenic corrinoid protein MtbC1
MGETITAVRAAGVPVKIMVGGTPVTPGFARDMGADGFSPDAGSAVDAALALLKS